MVEADVLELASVNERGDGRGFKTRGDGQVAGGAERGEHGGQAVLGAEGLREGFDRVEGRVGVFAVAECEGDVLLKRRRECG